MKKEANKKSKLWLWIVIGVVAAALIAGAVFAVVMLAGGGASSDNTGRPDLYWNLDKETYMPEGSVSSNREKAEDGYFHIRFAYNGQQVELLAADKQLVNYLDGFDVMGVVLDGNGYLVDVKPAKEVASVVGEDYYVHSAGDEMVVINSSALMNGMKKELTVTALTEIYEVSPKAEVKGEKISVDQLETMDKVSVYGDADGQVTHIFVESHAKESKVYWRANQFSSGGKTTREKDENGYYTIPFYCEGERVELKSKDEVEVSYIDKQSRYSAHFGLVFDDDGYIIEAIHSYEAIRGMIRAERYDVTAIEGNTVTTTKIIGSNTGVSETFTLGENCTIYDVSPAAVSEDRAGKPVDSLQLGDRIVCFADADGNPLFIYISERVVEEAIWCYNRERKYDSTLKETKRVPDSNGWYYFDVFAEGKLLTVKTNSKDVANEMDAVGAGVFGLILDGDVVVEVYGVTSVFGYSHFGQGRYITSVTGSIFSCISSSDPSKVTTGVLDPSCKIWNLSEVGTYGEETTLQYGDYIYAYQNPYLQIVQIWVMRRMVDSPIYTNTTRKYDSTNKVTTRVPDENGWYIFDMVANGKAMQVKTQSKTLATKIDAFSPAEMTLVLGSDGVVYQAYSAACSNGGYRRASGYIVTAINADGTVDTVYTKTGATRKLYTTKDTRIYNTGEIYSEYRGEPTSLRVGDKIASYSDIYDKAAVINVRSRQAGSLYWNTEKMYDDTENVSTRVPDADGWYIYELAVDGEVKTFKTQDKALADKLDYYGGAFCITHRDGVIKCVASPSYAKDSSGTSLLNYDVVKISGSKITLQYHAEGSSKDGEIQTITLSSRVKIYDVSPTAEKFGAVTQLKVGDRVRAYNSETGDDYSYVFIRFRDTHAGGASGYCQACEKEVYWTPWVGGSFSTSGGHFYLNANVETLNLPCSTGRSTLPTTTVCLDLNGNTYYRVQGRPLYVYANATLNIMDTAGGGTVMGGGTENGTSGGVLCVSGGTVNFYGGTLKLAEEHADQIRGGVVYIGNNTTAETIGTLNMYGGTITGGEVLGRGGSVSISGGVMNMYDGLVENGKVIGGYSGEHGGGGNILTLSGGTFNMYGGTVTGGTCYGAGGNIYGGTGAINIYGGTVSNGTAQTSGGGNIYAIEKLYIGGGTITGGTSEKKSGGNLYLLDYNDNSKLEIVGGTISDGTSASYGGNLYTEVAATVKDATFTGGKAQNGGSIYGNKDMVLEGATITGGQITTEKGSGGNIYIGAGNWTLNNTTISGGVSGGRGGNIYATNAVITMNSGAITNGTSGTGNANGGGNICTVTNSTFVLNGGTVSGGTSVNTGGNILAGSGGLQLNGGTVSGGTAPEKGADIYVYGGSTDVAISGGTVGTMEISAVKSLVMSGKPAFDKLILGAGVIADIENLDKKAGINLEANGIFTEKLTDATAYLECFTTKLDGYTIYIEDEALAMASGVKNGHCSHCDSNVIWKLWTETGATGHYYLDADYALTDKFGTEILEDNTVVLDLAGYDMVGDKVRAFDVRGNLFLMDSVGGGEVVTGGVTDENSVGGVVRARKGCFTLLGGTLRMADDHSETIENGGVIYIDKTAEVVLKGGAVMNGVTQERGGNIYLASGGAKLTVDGATVTGGTCGTGNSNGGGNIAILSNSVAEIKSGTVSNGTSPKTAGNILVTGTLKISGGTVTGGTATGVAQNIYSLTDTSTVEVTGGNIESLTSKKDARLQISGNPVIGMLELVDAQIITLGDMTDGADITVAADGVFTTEHENAQDYADKGYFKAADAEFGILVKDNKLAIGAVLAGGEIAPCEHCGGAEAEWFPWNGKYSDGHFYLEDTTQIPETVEILAGSTLVLDLRGKTATNAADRAFIVKGSLAIQDSAEGGAVIGAATGANGGVISVDGGSLDLYSGTLRYAESAAGANRGGVLYMTNNPTVNLRGGVVENGKTTERGGNIYVGGGVLNLSGAIVRNGNSQSSNANGGGNIFMLGNSVTTMTAGKVIGGTTSKTGGNICVGTATFIMEGGEISGGTATGKGANLYVYYNASAAEIKGGTIESVLFTDASSFAISGAPVIGNLEIAEGKAFTLGELTTGCDITVTATGVFTTENANAQTFLDNDYIRHSDAAMTLVVEDNKLSAVVPTTPDPEPPQTLTAYCQHCDAEVTWQNWDGAATDGHYYLAEGADLSAELEIPVGNTLVLELNGKTLQNASGRAFVVKGSLAIQDSAEDGAVIGAATGANGGVISVDGGSLDLYSGTLRYAESAAGASRGGVLYMINNPTVNLRGGVVENGKTTERGGNIYVGGGILNLSGAIVRNGNSQSSNANGGGNIFMLGSSVTTMTAGKVIGGTTSKTGGNICVGTATFIMEGGEISGGTATVKGANLYVYYPASAAEIKGGTIESVLFTDAISFAISGAPVIGNLEIAEGKAFTLGELTTGCDITVTATGVFTTENANAQSFVTNQYVKLADTTMYLIVEDNKLVVSDAPAGATKAACPHCEGQDALWYRWDGVTTSGHFYLSEEFTLSELVEIPTGSELILDLKSNNLKNAGGQVFKSYGDLAIIDSVGGGEIQGAASENGGVIYAEGGKLNLYSGTLRYIGTGTGPTHGGVLFLKGVTAELSGGKITDGKVKDRGGNIYMNGSSNVTISGTVISNGYSGGASSYGGGNIASLGNSTLNITGGKIENGKAVVNAGNLLAGSGTVTISGGEIVGGEAPVGADVLSYLAATSATLNITGGTIDEVSLYSASNGVTVSGNPKIAALKVASGLKFNLGELTEGASVKIMGNGVVTTDSDYAEAALTSNLVSTIDSYSVVLSGKTLSVEYNTNHICEHCDQAVTWTAWDGVSKNGHFYLAEDLSVTERVDPAVGDVLVLDLNGNTFTNTTTKVFSLKGALAILDTVGGGELVGSGVGSSMNGAVIYMANATFDLYGGTLRHAHGDSTAKRGGVLYVENSVANLRGGVIADGITSERGGNIYATGASTQVNLSGTTITGGHSGTGNSGVGGGNVFVVTSATFNMTGGKIVDGIADNYAGNVGVGSGTFKMSGGEISGGTAATAEPDVYVVTDTAVIEITGGKIANMKLNKYTTCTVSGAPVIGNLTIAEGKIITLGELTTGASITVNATGVFTNTNANAQAYLDALLIKAPTGKVITVTDNTMSMGDA